MLSGRFRGAIAQRSPVRVVELCQVRPLSVERTYFIGRVSVGKAGSKAPAVSRKKTQMGPAAVLKGIGYVAPRPSAMVTSVQVPALECGCGDRATHSSRLCRPRK